MIHNIKIVILILFAISIVAITAMSPARSSSGAPASHTGAPNEKTCAASTCHDDHSINSGSASLEIVMDSVYVPGQTYSLTIKISEPYVERFGFQVVVLTNADSSNCGSFQITDKKRTQLTRNQYELFDRSYVTYTFAGTDAVSTGIGEWTVNWTAPSVNVGPVTFYASGVSANDDGMDKGDYVYTASKTLICQ